VCNPKGLSVKLFFLWMMHVNGKNGKVIVSYKTVDSCCIIPWSYLVPMFPECGSLAFLGFWKLSNILPYSTFCLS
jgi:hypothetical protein